VRYVLLLRGINLGARNRIAMADLRGLLADLGHSDVRTHLQSGNAVVDAPTRSPAAVRSAVEAALAARYPFAVPVVVRTPAQLVAVVAHDPFRDVATDDARYSVLFADRAVGADALADLRAEAYAPERVAVRGSEVYLWMPDGQHRSRLAAVVERRLEGRTVTLRNWRTVRALAELATG
jgi:uncharacterized protein (DUF1697 family)